MTKLPPIPLPVQNRSVYPAAFFLGCTGLLALIVSLLAFGMLSAAVGRSMAGTYFLFRARSMQNEGIDHPGVIRYLNFAIALKPQSAEAYYRRCLHYSALHDDVKGILDCSKAIQLNPGYMAAYLHRGHAYFRLEDYIGAMYDYSTVVEHNKYLGEACYWQGQASYKLGIYSYAKSGFDCAVANGYSEADSLYWLGWSENYIGDYPAAITTFNKILKQKADHVDALIGRGVAFANGGNKEKGLQDINTAIELEPGYPLSYFHRADVFLLFKRYDLAIADLEHFLMICADEDLRSRAEIKLDQVRRRLNQTYQLPGMLLTS